MIDFPPGLSLTDTDAGILLRRTSTDSAPLEFLMSEDELLSLKETICLWSDRILSQRQAATGLQTVFSHSVVAARVLSDAMEAHVLITFRSPNGQDVTFEMAPQVAEHLVTEIPIVISEMKAAAPATKQ
jgi:hypothetical protein